MKKVVLRSIAIAAILTGVAIMLVWYWTMKREVPSHARVIPADAITVLTLNLRELARDLNTDKHLFPEMADQAMTGKELEPFIRAITNNDGKTGVEEISDVLAFVYQSGDAGFFGVALELEDSAEFGSLIRVHVAKEYNIQPLSMSGIPLMQFDTTAAIFGWTQDVALLLYPLGNHSIATVTAQCAKLLKQQKENSVLANEDFCEMELESFAMGLWVQTKPLIGFTDGGSLIEAIAHDVEAYSYLANFEDGEILIRSEWQLADDVKRDMIREFAFPCDTSLMNAFVRGHFSTSHNSVPGHSFADAAFDKLPVAEEEYFQLFSAMTGDFISIMHNNNDSGLFPYETHSFLLSDAAKAKAFLDMAMERDSIPLTPKGWTYSAGDDIRWRMILDGNMLTVTNHAGVDGRPHAITPDLAGYMAWYDLRGLLSEADGGISAFIPLVNSGSDLIAAHVSTCSSTLPVQFGNVRYSEIVFRFKNKDVNALVQAEELARKIYFEK